MPPPDHHDTEDTEMPSTPTRLQLDRPYDDTPTDTTPRVPRALRVPVRSTPPPTVNPPQQHTRDTGLPADTSEPPLAMINRVLDEQERLNAAHAARLGRLFRTRRRPPLTVKQEAARRVRHEQRHQRHMDALEAARAYLGIMCLVALFVLVAVLGAVAFGIMAGWFTWMPTRP